MTGSNRRQSIDLLRFVAAFGIVWAHMQAPFMIEGYLALALFVILTAFLSVRSLARGGMRRFWLGRLIRFLVPWVVWSGFFWGLSFLRGQGAGPLVASTPLWPLIGPSIHLWFLPFVILASPLIILGVWALTTRNRVWAASVGLIPLAIWSIWLHDQNQLPEPLLQWAFATTPLLYGILSASGQYHRAVAAPLVFIIVTSGLSIIWFGSVVAAYLLAAALLFEGLWRVPLKGNWMTPLGSLAFGIYLVHPFFMLIWYHFVPPEMSRIPGAFAVFLASTLFTYLIRQTKAGQVLV